MDNITATSFLSVIPLRANPSHSSEMVSQILFGELFDVLEKDREWVKIKTQYDDYTGWLDEKQIVYLNDAIVDKIHNFSKRLTKSLNHKIFKENSGNAVYLPAGADLLLYDDGKLYVGDHVYTSANTENIIEPDISTFKDEVLSVAKQFLGAPYLWGGRTHFGIDCSGLAQIVYKILGIKIKRDAWQQAEQGKLVDFLEEAQTGDLAFFDNEEGRITHVGIMINNNLIIHASGRVKIDLIDNQGIFSSDLKRYSHKLRIIKRYV